LRASLLFLTILAQGLSPSPSEELQRGKNAYDRGEFARAVDIIRPLLYPEIRLQSDAQIALAHRVLGVSHLFERREAEAKAEFRRLLQLAPDYHFDPLLDPPEVVDFFEMVRKGYSKELAQLEARRQELEKARQRDIEECERAREGPTVIERRVGRNSYAVNFVPFGAGQFQNGQRRKGWAFLTAESLLAAASVGAFATNLTLYGFRPQRSCLYQTTTTACPTDAIDHSQENRSHLLTDVQVATGAMFFAAVAWGVLDAIYYYRAETTLAGGDSESVRQESYRLRLPATVVDRTLAPGLSFRF